MIDSDFNTILGMQFVRAEDGECEISLDVDKRHMSAADRLIAKATGTFMLTETFVQSERERV